MLKNTIFVDFSSNLIFTKNNLKSENLLRSYENVNLTNNVSISAY